MFTCAALIVGCDPQSTSSHIDPEITDPMIPVDDQPGIRVSKPSFKDGHQEVTEGQSEFVSASGAFGSNGSERELDGAAESPEAADADSNERSVEEGDIYRVIGGGLMANLNHYRGLQLIDINDPSNPQLLSRLSLSGSPVEMYFIEGYAVVMMNNWWGYWGRRDDIAVDEFNGGLVALIDIRDPAEPAIVSMQPVPGYITTSRLTRGMGGDALFVVANDWSQGDTTTILRSFSVETGSAPTLRPASEVDLGGYVADIQATPSTLLIARRQGWWRSDDDEDGVYVSLVDISDPSGQVIEGASVRIEGYVRRKNDMHIHNGILRVVSSDWRDGAVVATWNIDDIQNPVSIDQARFGENEDLYASLFMRDRAFFVTYRRVDPFHAFSIDSEGLIEERTEYIISGWNDFFRPTFNQSRLIGIGMDDQVSEDRAMSIAVSLYTTDLEVEEPFIARAHGDLTGWSWSEARWDDRAFSVIEDAVSISGPDGITETGLVLLPFSGYDRDDEGWGSWRSGVQLFTFSDQSVTARGVMSHNSPVRRSFEPSEGVVGNLSELSFSLYDRSNPDEPSLLGQLDLAPEVSRVYFVGEGPARHPIRFRGSNDLFYGYYYDNRDLSPAKLQILPVGADVDLADPIAEVEVPARADLRQVGDIFYVFHDYHREPEDRERGDWTRHIDLQIIDLSDPTSPRPRGELDLTEIIEGYELHYDYRYDHWGCFDMGYYWWGVPQLEIHPVEGGLAVKTLERQSDSLGEFETCYLGRLDLTDHYTDDLPICDDVYNRWDEDEEFEMPEACQTVRSQVRCTRFVGETFSCQGQAERCVARFDEEHPYGVSECEAIEGLDYAAHAERQSRQDRSCHTYDYERRWGSMHLNFIDTQDLDAPQMSAEVVVAPHQRFEGLIEQEGQLFYSYSVPVEVEGDRISYVRHFTKAIDHRDLSDPELGVAVNLPGKLLLKRGGLMLSRDLVWGPEHTQSALNLTELNDEGTRATLITRHLFEGRRLQKLHLDRLNSGEERLVVSHSFDYQYRRYYDYAEVDADDSPYLDRVSVFNLSDLDLLGEAVSDSWSSLISVNAGKGVFRVGGGVLLMDLSDPAEITPQAFFPIRGWNPRLTLEGDSIYAAAGRYGVYSLPLNSFNLLPPL